MANYKPYSNDVIMKKTEGWREEVQSAYADWLRNCVKLISYRLNKQWDNDTMQKLKAKGQPALTFNEIAPIINLVSGYQRQNRIDIRIAGVEGGDNELADQTTLLIKHVMRQSKGQQLLSEMFDDGITCSRSFCNADIDYTKDPLVGDVVLNKMDYDEIFPDPLAKKYDFSDGNYLVVRSFRDKDYLKSIMPKYAKKIDNMTDYMFDTEAVNMGFLFGFSGKVTPNADIGRTTTLSQYPKKMDNILLVEDFWYKRYQKVDFMYTVDMLTAEVRIEEVTGKYNNDEMQYLQETNENVIFKSVEKAVICVARMINEKELLYNEVYDDYPYLDRFPFSNFICNHSSIGKRPELMFQSMVNSLIDPQNEINKRSSQQLNLINKSANTGFIYGKDDLTPDMKAILRDYGTVPGINIELAKDNAQFRRLEPINTAGLPYERLAEQSSMRIKRISNINESTLGIDEGGVKSGRAIALQQQQGVTGIQPIFDNLQSTMHSMAYNIIGLINANYTPDKIVRIIGQDKISMADAEYLLTKVDAKHYDFAFDTQRLSPVMRYAYMEQLLNLVEKGIIPFELVQEDIIEASDVPNKQKILSRLTQMKTQVQAGAVGSAEMLPQAQEQPVQPPLPA